MQCFSSEIPYLNFINNELTISDPNPSLPVVIDLFAGCGGLSLGFEAVGFRTVGYEMDADSARTYRQNLQGECYKVKLDLDSMLSNIDRANIIIGGPPCQPFSQGGHQLGLKDSRDGFPIFLSAIERYQPEIAIFENVRGMKYRNKFYLEEIVDFLQKLGYCVEWKVLNAVRYGVPQRRERLFCVAHKSRWQWPKITHPYHVYTVGEALGDLAFSIPDNAQILTPSMDRYVNKYEIASQCARPRDLYLDAPSRTVTCRNLGAPTGDMLRIRLPDGRRRRLIPREGARLQSFPDWFQFYGNDRSQCKQIGNAVPPLLAKAIAQSVKRYLQPDLEDISFSADLQPRQLSFSFLTDV